jgi:alcohol dehydrogenase
MIKKLEEFQPDEVLAIGGGSPMDAAKAAYLVYQAGGDLSDYFGMNKFSEANPGKKLKKVICIPTTSGTGSEATPYSNIVDRKLNVKKLIVDTQIIPEYSFIEPSLTVSMPKSVTKATGLDALSHSLEGFLNVGQDEKCPEANTWALESIKLIVSNLPKALEDPQDIEARTALSAAACLGGMVIRNKSTALPHLCSFSWFGKIDHGIATAVLLPYAWNYYLESDAIRARTLELKKIFPGNTPEEIVKSYASFIENLSVPLALKEHDGIDKELLETTARTASENKMKLELAPKPVPLEKSREVLSNLLENAWEGKC